MQANEFVFLQVPVGDGYATIVFSDTKPTLRNVRHLIEFLTLVRRQMGEEAGLSWVTTPSIEDVPREHEETAKEEASPTKTEPNSSE